MEETYKYTNIELTPMVFAELLILLFDGKQFTRQDALDSITQYHRDHNGRLDKQSYVPAFKKATKILSDKGIQHDSYGVWRLNYKKKEVEFVKKETNLAEFSYEADIVLGEGKSAVYLYYYDSYKEKAKLSGKDVWECKIGRSETDPLQRVFSQAGTSFPEMPHIAIVMKCNNSNHLENAIHSILKTRNQWLESAPGTEWFLTSPDEIELIYKMIIGETKH